jgi:hypothetical protein
VINDRFLGNGVKGGKAMDLTDFIGKNNRSVPKTVVPYAFAHGGLDKSQLFDRPFGWGILLLGECL